MCRLNTPPQASGSWFARVVFPDPSRPSDQNGHPCRSQDPLAVASNTEEGSGYEPDGGAEPMYPEEMP